MIPHNQKQRREVTYQKVGGQGEIINRKKAMVWVQYNKNRHTFAVPVFLREGYNFVEVRKNGEAFIVEVRTDSDEKGE
jgi:hypothetical protein